MPTLGVPLDRWPNPRVLGRAAAGLQRQDHHARPYDVRDRRTNCNTKLYLYLLKSDNFLFFYFDDL